MNYKELANKMRRTVLEYKGGNLSVSPELWEDLADMLEKKPQGAPLAELLLWIVKDNEFELTLRPSMFPGDGEIMLEMRKDGTKFQRLFKYESLRVIPLEEGLYFSMKYMAERFAKRLEEEA